MINPQHQIPFVFDRQLLLADLIGNLDWAFDLQAGVLSFGNRYYWRAEVLGTESEESGTWLWAWANEASSIPAKQQTASFKLKALGEEHGISEFTEPMSSLEHTDGHILAAISVGEGLGKAYYRGPYEGGAVFLLITDDQLRFKVSNPVERILTVFPQVISTLELPNHRDALRGYLQHYGIVPEEENGALVVRESGKTVLRAEFDGQRRLRELNGELRNQEGVGE